MKHSLSALVTASTLLIFSGCAVVNSGPGDKYGDTPPKLTSIEYKDANGKMVSGLTWDEPSAFGPVPASQQAAGDKVCQSVGSKKATGYHPKAQAANGKPLAAGGYFCE